MDGIHVSKDQPDHPDRTSLPDTITVISGKDVLDDLKKNIFNDRIWPDFSRIPSPEHPVLRYKSIGTTRSIQIDGYRITMEKVHYPVPAYGYIVEKPGMSAIAYTGETGPTERFRVRMSALDVKYLITETTFPNRLEKLAVTTCHLPLSLLEKEIARMSRPPEKIFIMHIKPRFLQEIETEVQALGRDDIESLKDGEVILA